MMDVTLRASSLGDFLDCPARAEARHLLGQRMPMSPKALLGKAIHRSTAVFDSSTLTGAGVTADEAAGIAVDAVTKPDEEVAYLEDDNTAAEVAGIAVALHKKYCKEIAPTQTYAAVEVKCDAIEITDLGLTLTGTTDRIRRGAEGYGIADLKSGGTAVRADGHVETKGAAYQLGAYELLAERGSGLSITEPAKVIGLQTGKTERGQRVAVSHDIVGARDTLLGDQDQPGVLEAISRMIQSGTFIGNPKSMLCHVRYCPIYQSCRFRR